MLGRAALRVFTRSHTRVITTSTVYSEVREHIPVLAGKYSVDPAKPLRQLQELPVEVFEQEAYQDLLAEAERRIGRRDPMDIPLLALALKMKVSIWSNDNDFEDGGVEWFTTAELLALLGV